jgi:hypothetical protein
MDVICSSETSVHIRSTRRYISEIGNIRIEFNYVKSSNFMGETLVEISTAYGRIFPVLQSET